MEKFNEHRKTFEQGTTRLTINRFIDLRWGRETDIQAWNPNEETYEQYMDRQQQDEVAVNSAADEYITSVELKELMQDP